MGQRQGQVIFTNRARCRDCYRCLRVCPVKAIRLEDGQATVVEELCIACGTCIKECPQDAKAFRNDLDIARHLIASGRKVAAGIAPSFAGLYTDWECGRLPSALRQLGFAHVSETSVGAYHVACDMAKILENHPDHPQICTACPAVVNFIEKHEPDLVNWLAPVESPMVAQARLIREKTDCDAVVFIGPCFAKKTEVDRPDVKPIVDVALSFLEMDQWLEEEGVKIESCEESGFDWEPGGESRFFPLPGGLLRTAGLDADSFDVRYMTVSGEDDLRQALEYLRGVDSPVLLEALFCREGCINGPGTSSKRTLFSRKTELEKYAHSHPGNSSEPRIQCGKTEYRNAGCREEFTEEDIRRVLVETGKGNPEDQLNCGSCGYNSCREKAIAVLRGMAEPEMCLPLMRRLAEQRTDKIIETSPNGIVILDDRLEIIHMNPAFRKCFFCSEAVIGKHISYLIDPEPFEKLTDGSELLVDDYVTYDSYNRSFHRLVYRLDADNQYVGIFVDVTQGNRNKEKLMRLKAETMNQASELMEHQIAMSQQMAQFLGESTARGERILHEIIRLTGEESDRKKGEESNKLWDMYTSKPD